MAFAGLSESWLGADGSEMDTMAILTVAANSTVGVIHDRMPAILAPSQFDAWLDCRSVDIKPASAMLVPAADDLLEIVEVSSRLNSVRNEGADLQRPDPTSIEQIAVSHRAVRDAAIKSTKRNAAVALEYHAVL